MNPRAAAMLIQQCRFCVIATASRAAQPWLSPVFFNYDDDLSIYFESAADALHSQLIAVNPKVAVVITDFETDPAPRAVYLEGKAFAVDLSETDHALQVLEHGPHHRERKSRQASDYGVGSPLRLYRAVPHRLFGLRAVDVDGYSIEQRVDLSIEDVRLHLQSLPD